MSLVALQWALDYNRRINIHSSLDTMDLLNLEHMTNFTRLGIAFAIEMAGE